MSTCRSFTPPVIRPLTVPERLLLRLLMEQFEVIGRVEPSRLVQAFATVLPVAPMGPVLDGLYAAGRVEDYDGMPNVVRDAAGVRVYAALVHQRRANNTNVDLRAQRIAEAVAYLVGRKRITTPALAAALGATTAETQRVIGALMDRGLITEMQAGPQCYLVREVAP